jgi:cobalt/nickel transport system permease protein
MLLLAVALPPWPGAVLVLAAMAGALAFTRHRWRDLAAVLALPLGFLATGALALMVSVDPAGPGPLFAISGVGVATAGKVVLRSAAAVSALTFLIVTTPLADLTWLMRRAGLPVALVEVMQLTYRFVLLATDMAATGVNAQKARLGWQGATRSWRSAGMLGAALLPRLLDRARRLEAGLAARGPIGELRMLTPEWAFSARAVGAIAAAEAAVVGVALCLR